MTTIKLDKFPGKTYKDVYCLVMNCPDISYAIHIKKKPLNENPDEYAPLAYIYAFYAAACLVDICTDVEYYVPSIRNADPFIFYVEVVDKEKFIDLLYNLLGFYNTKYIRNNPESTFGDDGGDFFIDLEKRADEPLAWGLSDYNFGDC